MQMKHYLIKYALICMYFKKQNLSIDKARFKILFSLCSHIGWEKNYRGIYGYLFLLSCKSEYTANCLKKWFSPCFLE